MRSLESVSGFSLPGYACGTVCSTNQNTSIQLCVWLHACGRAVCPLHTRTHAHALTHARLHPPTCYRLPLGESDFDGSREGNQTWSAYRRRLKYPAVQLLRRVINSYKAKANACAYKLPRDDSHCQRGILKKMGKESHRTALHEAHAS